MRISDWSSDVCSSDLDAALRHAPGLRMERTGAGVSCALSHARGTSRWCTVDRTEPARCTVAGNPYAGIRPHVSPNDKPLKRITTRNQARRQNMYDDLAAKIRQRAYLIWEHENRPDGKDLEHWLRAEAEIKTDQSDATNQAEDRKSTRLNSSH